MVSRDATFRAAVSHALDVADDFSRRLGSRIRETVSRFSPLNAATRARLMQQLDALLNAAFGVTQRAALLSDLFLSILTATDLAASRPFQDLFARMEQRVSTLGADVWARVRGGLLSAPQDDPLARAYQALTSPSTARTTYLREGRLNPNLRWVKGDGTSYRLSDRVWKQGRRVRQLIDRIVRDGIRGGAPPAVIGAALERYIVPGASPSASSMARTLAQTETTRIYHEAEKRVAAIAPDILGLRWLLSRHAGNYDICDDYARADDFGLGPGGYPPRFLPDPPHPNCQCRRGYIYREDVDLAASVIGRFVDPETARQFKIPNPFRKKLPASANPITTPSGFPPLGSASGASVSRAMRIEGMNFAVNVNPAFAAIDRIHGDGALPKIRVAEVQGVGAVQGFFDEKLATPLMGISRQATSPAMTALHETAHALDTFGFRRDASVALGSPVSEVIPHPGFDPLISAYERIPDIQRFKSTMSSASTVGDLNELYYLRREEIWARSYAQFIATYSNEPTLIEELAFLRTRAAETGNPLVLADDDFRTIAPYIIDLLEGEGWLTPSAQPKTP